MIKRINISLAGLLCLGGQYEHILCTATTQTNDTTSKSNCVSIDDIDYDTCHLDNLSDAELYSICNNARGVDSPLLWSRMINPKWLKVKDTTNMCAHHEDLVSDAEICIAIKEKIQLYLLKQCSTSYICTAAEKETALKRNKESNRLVNEIYAIDIDVNISGLIIQLLDLARTSDIFQFQTDPLDYIQEMSYVLPSIVRREENYYDFLYNPNIDYIDFIMRSLLEYEPKKNRIKVEDLLDNYKQKEDDGKDSGGSIYPDLAAVAVIGFHSLIAILFFFMVMYHVYVKARDKNEQEKQKMV